MVLITVLTDLDVNPAHPQYQIHKLRSGRLPVRVQSSFQLLLPDAIDPRRSEFDGLVPEDEGRHAPPELDRASKPSMERIQRGEGEERRQEEEKEDFSSGVRRSEEFRELRKEITWAKGGR